MGALGFEPKTIALKVRCSAWLSYTPDQDTIRFCLLPQTCYHACVRSAILRSPRPTIAGSPRETRSPRAVDMPSNSTKPKKPYPDLPPFQGATGRWAQQIRGKLTYLGPGMIPYLRGRFCSLSNGQWRHTIAWRGDLVRILQRGVGLASHRREDGSQTMPLIQVKNPRGGIPATCQR